MFSGSTITDTQKTLDFTKLSRQASSVFQNCASLKTIRTLTVNETNTFASWFTGCTNLTNISFSGTIGNSIDFVSSNLLTNDSMSSIINALMTITDGVARTLTLHPDVKAKLTDAQKTIITAKAENGGKGWTLA